MGWAGQQLLVLIVGDSSYIYFMHNFVAHFTRFRPRISNVLKERDGYGVLEKYRDSFLHCIGQCQMKGYRLLVVLLYQLAMPPIQKP